MSMSIKRLLFLFSITLVLSPSLYAQTSNTTAQDEMQMRVKQLEAQVQMMQAELEKLKQAANKPATVEPAVLKAESAETVSTVAASDRKDAPLATTAKPEAKQQPKKDLGVDIGSARLTPYGTIYLNAFGNSGGVNNTDVPTFATQTGIANVSASVRQTRLGFRLEGARIGNARLGGVIEADFFGGFPNSGNGENFGVVRLRLANARLDWERTSITVGQDWMVFAPANPTSIASAAVPQLASAGNPWMRLPQIKLEQRVGSYLTFQGAVLAPSTGDYPAAGTTPFALQPSTGAASSVPFLQSRVAVSDKTWFGTKKAGSIGLSTHFGRSQVSAAIPVPPFSDNKDIDSYGVALDWNFPLANRLTWSGEAFHGANLAGFQAGVAQGFNAEFVVRNGNIITLSGVKPISTLGGWTQLGFTPPGTKDRLTIYGSLGIDNPEDEDLVTQTRRDLRTQNVAYALSAIYKFTPQFSFSAEFRRFQTQYVVTGKRDANHFNLGASYSF